MLGRSARLVLGAIARWSLGLVAVALGFHVWTVTSAAGPIAAWRLTEAIERSAGTLLPVAAFAGGLAAAGLAVTAAERVRVSWSCGLLVALLSYVLLAFGTPIAEHRADGATGQATEIRYPYGPHTPVALVAMLRHVRENPPERYSFSTDRPLAQPPSWLLYSLHLPATVAVFAVLNTFVGLLVGALTNGLSPPERRHTRWGIGLGLAIGFFVASSVAGASIRSAPSGSALLAAWLPLLLPAVVAAAAFALQRGRRALHASRPGVV